MKTMLRWAAALSASWLMAGPALALEPGQVVDNFRLLDQNGKSHELYYSSDMKAVVLMVQGNGCPIVRQALPALAEVRDKYASQGVEFLLLNSNIQDSRDSIAKEAAEFKIDFPILLDQSQLVGESLGVVRTSEVFVIDPKGWKLVYRGPMDDRLSYEKQRPAAQKLYLADALDAMLAGQAVKVPKADGVGCLVNFPERDKKQSHAKISYSNEIAPLLMDKCVACHQTGGVGPWAMTSYDMVKGFAPMIREVVRTQRMPPWHADPHYGKFQDVRAMSEDQRKLLVHWIEAGAPRGKGEDPLLKIKPDTREWKHGTPNLVVDVPAYDIPATGVIEYQYPKVKNPLGRDVWITAVEFQPGARQAIHHIIAQDPVVEGAKTGDRGGGNLGGFAPGMSAVVYPPDTGVLFPKDADFVFQMHYTPNGKAVTDHSKVAFYFREADDPPTYPLRLTALVDFRFEIPPGAKEYTSHVTRPITRDILIYNLMPHSHLRGKAGTMSVVYPDGKEEILLNVPKYDFNWQTVYAFQEPKKIPAGSKLVWDFSWDNSAQNPANPDPTKAVHWGDQTFEEMGIGFVRYRYLDEVVDKSKVAGAAPAEKTASALDSSSH